MKRYISDYMIAIIVGTIFIAGFMMMLGEVVNRNVDLKNSDDVKSFNNTFYRLDNVTTNFNKINSSIDDLQGQTLLGEIGIIFNSVLGTWKTIISSLGFFYHMISSGFAYFGFPTWLPVLIISLIVVISGFAFFRVLWGRTP